MRILIIENEHKVTQALKRVLQQEHYAVDISHDSEEGYNLAVNEPYDLAIISTSITGSMDALSVIKSLREQSIHTPILILSTESDPKSKASGLDAGADDYLVKPFALEELLARVRALMRRPAEQQPSVLKADDLELNTVTFEVSRGGTPISLTSKEFALLEFLLRNPGRPLSKETIISHVWDYDADVLPNTVEVYIKYLRQKIDEPFTGKKPIIQTARGFGYKVDPS
jgi:DNA-binding response OmpR family regulator